MERDGGYLLEKVGKTRRKSRCREGSPRQILLTGAGLAPSVPPWTCSMPFFVDSLQGTHCAFVCTFVRSGLFPLLF